VTPDEKDHEIALLKTQLADLQGRYAVAVQGLRNLAFSVKMIAYDLANLGKKGDEYD